MSGNYFTWYIYAQRKMPLVLRTCPLCNSEQHRNTEMSPGMWDATQVKFPHNYIGDNQTIRLENNGWQRGMGILCCYSYYHISSTSSKTDLKKIIYLTKPLQVRDSKNPQEDQHIALDLRALPSHPCSSLPLLYVDICTACDIMKTQSLTMRFIELVAKGCGLPRSHQH